MREDYLIRAVGAAGQLKIAVIDSTQAAETARAAHQTSPVATAALGRTLTAALLLGTNLKGDDLLTLRFLGDGPLGGIVVSAAADYQVRGYVVNPGVDLPLNSQGKLDVAQAVGQGTLAVTKDLGLKEPYSGTVEIVSGEIAADIAHYLQASEQINSAVSLGVLIDRDCTVKTSGGFMLQLLPGAADDVLLQLEENLDRLQPVSTMLNNGLTPEDILQKLLQGLDYEILEKSPVSFCCNCSQKRFEKVLISLGKKELEDLARIEDNIELQCHFCSQKYYFSPQAIQKLLQELS